MCDMCETLASREVSCDHLRTGGSQVIASDSQISVCPSRKSTRKRDKLDRESAEIVAQSESSATKWKKG